MQMRAGGAAGLSPLAANSAGYQPSNFTALQQN
jgi:hypothetical protein